MINLDVDELQLYIGDDYVINDHIKVLQPTIKQIAEFGEKEFFSVVHTVTAIPSDMKANLWDMGLDWMEVDDFELFVMLSQTLTPDRTKLLFGNLDFTKSDFSTGNSLPNCKIEIYKIDGTLIFTGITDDLGSIKIDDLPIGSYYLLEKEAPEGYMLNPNKMYFSITENGEIIKATLTDELIIHDVPSTDKNEFPIIETISMVICLIGFGVIMYVKKKK